MFSSPSHICSYFSNIYMNVQYLVIVLSTYYFKQVFGVWHRNRSISSNRFRLATNWAILASSWRDIKVCLQRRNKRGTQWDRGQRQWQLLCGGRGAGTRAEVTATRVANIIDYGTLYNIQPTVNIRNKINLKWPIRDFNGVHNKLLKGIKLTNDF